MTTAQRQHAKKLMDQFHAHAAQVLYPPQDQRNGVEAYDWGLTEAQLTTLLLNGHQLEFDCSDSSSWIYTAIGVWLKSRGPGYTGTWLEDLGLQRYTNGKTAGLASPRVLRDRHETDRPSHGARPHSRPERREPDHLGARICRVGVHAAPRHHRPANSGGLPRLYVPQRQPAMSVGHG